METSSGPQPVSRGKPFVRSVKARGKTYKYLAVKEKTAEGKIVEKKLRRLTDEEASAILAGEIATPSVTETVPVSEPVQAVLTPQDTHVAVHPPVETTEHERPVTESAESPTGDNIPTEPPSEVTSEGKVSTATPEPIKEVTTEELVAISTPPTQPPPSVEITPVDEESKAEPTLDHIAPSEPPSPPLLPAARTVLPMEVKKKFEPIIPPLKEDKPKPSKKSSARKRIQPPTSKHAAEVTSSIGKKATPRESQPLKGIAGLKLEPFGYIVNDRGDGFYRLTPTLSNFTPGLVFIADDYDVNCGTCSAEACEHTQAIARDLKRRKK